MFELTFVNGAVFFKKRLPWSVLLFIIIDTLNVTEFRFGHSLFISYLLDIEK